MEGLVKQLLTLSRIEAAPALAMNDRIDVPDDAAGGGARGANSQPGETDADLHRR